MAYYCPNDAPPAEKMNRKREFKRGCGPYPSRFLFMSGLHDQFERGFRFVTVHFVHDDA
jgi:hypothetical protein